MQSELIFKGWFYSFFYRWKTDKKILLATIKFILLFAIPLFYALWISFSRRSSSIHSIQMETALIAERNIHRRNIKKKKRTKADEVSVSVASFIHSSLFTQKRLNANLFAQNFSIILISFFAAISSPKICIKKYENFAVFLSIVNFHSLSHINLALMLRILLRAPLSRERRQGKP